MIHKFDLKIHVFDYTKYRVKVKKQGKERKGMSTWDIKVNDGWSHVQPCACAKCAPSPGPEEILPKEKKLSWKEKMIRMNYEMREDAALTIQKNYRKKVQVQNYKAINQVTPHIKKEACMVVTPVSLNAKSPARRDWLEQVQRRKEGKQHVWDDSKQNHAERGDLFAYVENSIKMGENQKSLGWIEVYVIQDVHSFTDRLPTWSGNVGQGNRNVVELSNEPIYKGSMVEWKGILGYAERYCVQGTTHLKHERIKEYLNKIL